MERKLIEKYMLTSDDNVKVAIGHILQGYPMNDKRRLNV